MIADHGIEAGKLGDDVGFTAIGVERGSERVKKLAIVGGAGGFSGETRRISRHATVAETGFISGEIIFGEIDRNSYRHFLR